MEKNVERDDRFSQVCVWPGIIVGDKSSEFVNDMRKFFGVRVVYLEEITTLPGNGGPGNRNDLFFGVHTDDINKFAIPRLEIGIRWVEDAISQMNGGCEIYPLRVQDYRSWGRDL